MKCAENRICSIWNLQCAKYGTGTYRKWNVQKMECAENGMGIIWNVQKMEGAKCGMCKVWNVQTMKCAKYGICVLWIVQNMECAEYGMCRTWNVQNIEVANVHEIECAENGMYSLKSFAYYVP